MSTTDPFAGIARGSFAAILTDVPSRFETWSDKGKGRSAERHYPVMTWEDLRALDVASLAAPDCVLFHWITWPTLPQQLDMFGDDADVALGMGYWTRQNSEPCPVGHAWQAKAAGRREKCASSDHCAAARAQP